jgi:two-component system sensor histidine kinase BaeS
MMIAGLAAATIVLVTVLVLLWRHSRSRRRSDPAPSIARRGVKLQRSVIAIAPLLEQAVARMRERFAERGFELIVEAADPKLRLPADAARLDQALTFLLDNTLRHADPPGPVRIDLQRNDQSIRLVISDAGPPVPRMALRRMFDRDYHTDLAGSRVAGDNRHGLAICRTLIEAHGGSIDASPSREGGVSFEILLPVAGASTR